VGGSLNFVAKAGAPPFAGELRSERQLGTLSVGCQRIKAASRHGSLKTGAFARPCLLYLDTHVTRSRNSLGITALTRGARCKRTYIFES
jgi:hypothetical protein